MQIILIALSFLSVGAFAENPGTPTYDYRPDLSRVSEAARQANERYVEHLIRREVTRPSSDKHRSKANCGESYWTKAEARALCPRDTVLKIVAGNLVYYACDCSEN